MNIGIVGAGIIGQLMALKLLQLGHTVTLFEQCFQGKESASRMAAGMLSPYAELEHADPGIYHLGVRALALWPAIIDTLNHPAIFNQQGSLLLAHSHDMAELHWLAKLIKTKVDATAVTFLQSNDIKQVEPELANFHAAYLLANEATLDVPGLFMALSAALLQLNVGHIESRVTHINSNTIHITGKSYSFDHVFDCRGMGAKADINGLRGVRGEALYLYAPEVTITRPVRLLHPRYRLYIVPKKNQHYYIGATEVECEVEAPITVRSTLELLTAAYSVHSGFAEAKIIKNMVGIRPVTDNHLPLIEHAASLTRINGLYRHGFLVAPALVEEVMQGLSF